MYLGGLYTVFFFLAHYLLYRYTALGSTTIHSCRMYGGLSLRTSLIITGICGAGRVRQAAAGNLCTMDHVYQVCIYTYVRSGVH